jgi:hypothetical protein
VLGYYEKILRYFDHNQGVTVFCSPSAQEERNKQGKWAKKAVVHQGDDVMPG